MTSRRPDRSTQPAMLHVTAAMLMVAAGVCWSSTTALAQPGNAAREQADRLVNNRPKPAAETDRINIATASTADRARYDTQAVVRVHARTPRELLAATRIATGVWSERLTLGGVELRVERDRIADLIELGLDVEIIVPNVQELIDAEWASIQLASINNPAEQAVGHAGEQAGEQAGNGPLARGAGIDDSWYTNFKQFPDILNRLAQLAAAHPALATTELVGQSVEGRDLVGIRITGPDTPENPSADRPRIVWNGGQHAREWVGPMTVAYLAEALVSLYDTDPQIRTLVDTVEFIIVPVVNPDGYVYSWTNERLWRKNRRNGFGVDLNRNWSVGWGGEGSSGDTGDSIYRGTAPFSEPESSALRDVMLNAPNLVGHIDFHSFSQLILRPYGYTFDTPPAAENTFFTALGAQMQSAILSSGGVFYQNIPGADLYLASGIMSDWAYDVGGAYSYTFELRPDSQNPGFILEPEEILPTARETLAAMRVYAQTLTQPFRMDLVEGPSGTIEPGTTPTVSVAVDELPGSFDQGVVDPATVRLEWSILSDAGTQAGSAAMTTSTGTVYSASLPEIACGSTVVYQVVASSTTGMATTTPGSSAEAIGSTLALLDDAETDTGWTIGVPSDTATTGQWERGNPQGTDAQPESDASEVGTDCYITGLQAGSGVGSFDIDGGTTTLISPSINALATSGEPGDAYIGYSRWYSNDRGNSPNADAMDISISQDDGQTWVPLETVSENLDRWESVSFRVADFIEPTGTVRVRFVASDLGDGSIVEAGIDDLRLDFIGCPDTPITDWNADGSVNILDVIAFISSFNSSDPQTDLNSDGMLNILDVIAFITLWNAG